MEERSIFKGRIEKNPELIMGIKRQFVDTFKVIEEFSYNKIFIVGGDNEGKTSFLELIKKYTEGEIDNERDEFLTRIVGDYKFIECKFLSVNCRKVRTINDLAEKLPDKKISFLNGFKVRIKAGWKGNGGEAEKEIKVKSSAVERMVDARLKSRCGLLIVLEHSFEFLKQNKFTIIDEILEELRGKNIYDIIFIIPCTYFEFINMKGNMDDFISIKLNEIDTEDIKKSFKRNIDNDEVLNISDDILKDILVKFDYMVNEVTEFLKFCIHKYRKGFNENHIDQYYKMFLEEKYYDFCERIRKLDYRHKEMLVVILKGNNEKSKDDIREELGINERSTFEKHVYKLQDLGLVKYKDNIINIRSEFVKDAVEKVMIGECEKVIGLNN